ncbi:MAG: cytochrome c biogenesis protein CcsA [Deltaproteobacteria bacterium]|nr:cytochrome c biogenesis protein CcsA [Deltaproteobacteria bacterium]
MQQPSANGIAPAPKAPGRLGVAYVTLAALTGVLMLGSLAMVFGYAPQAQLAAGGIVQKIFYFHVPSAYVMYVGVAVCCVASIVYLITRKDTWDAVALAGAEMACVFCLIVLITGPLWARRAWGVYWVWDARLTTTLLCGLVFIAYLVLRAFGTDGEAEKRFAAALGIFGAVDAPFVHWSVQRWRGQHPTVITSRGGGLDPDMKTTLLVCFVAFTAFAVLLLWTRIRAELDKQRVARLRLEIAAHGLGEDG